MEPFVFDSRPLASTFVDQLWRTTSTQSGQFISVAETHWGLVVTTYRGQTSVALRGPETYATPSPVPEDAEFFGIVFRLGAHMPDLPVSTLVDAPVMLPGASGRSFWLNGRAWEIPRYDNADVFVDRLVHSGLLIYDNVVGDALRGYRHALSPRSVQRRFLGSTGLTEGAIYQIQRARMALDLLESGVPILDVVERAGYSDQPHMTRALKRLTGQTPAQIQRDPQVHS